MPVVGLVITLSHQEQLAAQAIADLNACPQLNVGQREGRRVAVASDTESDTQDKNLREWMLDLEGVVAVAPVVAWLDQPVAADSPASSLESAHREEGRL